ncbi:hypothetical protein F5883DRAFT_568531, partial [Diaporthe sp. PMI_573]
MRGKMVLRLLFMLCANPPWARLLGSHLPRPKAIAGPRDRSGRRRLRTRAVHRDATILNQSIFRPISYLPRCVSVALHNSSLT